MAQGHLPSRWENQHLYLQPRVLFTRPSGGTHVSMANNPGSLDFPFYLKMAPSLFSDDL